MTNTFDGWNAPENSLMHFRTKGSKNGVRRFQNEDGTWTPLGLRERKEREGWGDEGPTRKEAKAQRRLERAERHEARRTARAEAKAAAAEAKRKSSLKGLTDEELRNKINRLKMEQEYKELSKSPLLKTGEKLVATILENQANKDQREIERNRQKIELERIKTERVKALEDTKRAKEETKKAESELKKAKTKSAEDQAKANLVNQKTQAKRYVADYTIRGGLKKRINAALTAGYADKKGEARYQASIRKGIRSIDRMNDRRANSDKLTYSGPPDRNQFSNANKHEKDKKKK